MTILKQRCRNIWKGMRRAARTRTKGRTMLGQIREERAFIKWLEMRQKYPFI